MEKALEELGTFRGDFGSPRSRAVPVCVPGAASVTDPLLHKILQYNFISHSDQQLQDPAVLYGGATVH